MCKIIAITNQKGGCSKTTSTVNIGIGLARAGKSVLLIDADAQGSLTASLGFKRPDEIGITLATIMAKTINEEDIELKRAILKHEEGVDLIPGNIELSGLEVQLSNVLRRELILKEFVDSIREEYEYILIDCAPSLGMMTINALVAADEVIIPVQAAYLPVKGLQQLIKTINGTFFRMLESIDKNASTLDEKRLAQIYQNTIGAAFDEIKALLPADGIGIYSSTWLTAKLIEQDKLARSLVKETVDAGTYTAIEKKLSDVKDGNLLTGDCKFQWIDKLVNENVTSKKNKLLRSRFDKAATSKRWGKPIAIGMIVLGLICSMVIGFPLMGLFSGLISAISVPLANWLLDIGAAPFLVSLLCNAILTAVSFALQMASYVFGISLVFGLMEDVGYMARISYVFDDTMTKLGLQGKAIMPFLVSFGCNIGGITGTRVIDSWGQRVMTIALSWVVPCASTWGVVGLVSGTFFGNGAAVVVLALFAVAFLHIFITYKVFGRSLNKVEGRTGLIMELPPYHKPHWKSLFGSVFSKMGNVLSRALRIIICMSVIFWLLSYSADGNVANSIIYKVGTFIEPVTSLFGLPWQLFIAFVASAMGKEASLGVMASLFNTGSIWAAIEQSATVDTAALSTSMLSVISRPEALAFLFAFFFNMPCLMALTATTQETHSMKWTVRIALYYVLTALIMATIAYHVGLVIF